jgi:hypothetical protein
MLRTPVDNYLPTIQIRLRRRQRPLQRLKFIGAAGDMHALPIRSEDVAQTVSARAKGQMRVFILRCCRISGRLVLRMVVVLLVHFEGSLYSIKAEAARDTA